MNTSNEKAAATDLKMWFIFFGVVAALVVLYAVFVFKDKQPVQVKVPREFILSEQNLENIFDERNNLDFVRYQTQKPFAEVYDIMKAKLQSRGWKLITDHRYEREEAGASIPHAVLFAYSTTKRVNIFLKGVPSGGTAVEVTFLPQKK